MEWGRDGRVGRSGRGWSNGGETVGERDRRRMEEDSGGKGLRMQGMKWEMKTVDT